MKDRIVILGAGESGTGSAVLALKQGFDVFVSDLGGIKEKYRKELDSHKIKWEEGPEGITQEVLLQIEKRKDSSLISGTYYCFRCIRYFSCFLSILPLADLRKLSTNSTYLGTIKGSRFCVQYFMTISSVR